MTSKPQSRLLARLLSLSLLLGLGSCVTKTQNETVVDSSSVQTYHTAAPASTTSASIDYPVTLPVLDAFLADSSFASFAKSRAGLSDSDLVKVRTLAGQESARLEKAQNASTGDYTGSTADAKTRAVSVLDSAIGADKRTKLITLVQQEWSGRQGMGTAPNADSNSVEGVRNAVPKDTRVVVNIPAYRMDVYDSGTLQKSYKITIGYPEFPLPTGMRKANDILFNPTWTPPDEAWVESPKGKVKVGQKIAAGDKLNPLGVLKIPIGEPSLIHGGKAAAKLGTFGSHGCVGLVDKDATDFATRLAQLSGKPLDDTTVARFEKDKKSTHDVRLPKAVQVELRYETIVADSGNLHIYRDVYDHNTNTQANLESTLKAYGLTMKDLTAEEQSKVLVALHDMSKDITTNTDTTIVRNIALKDTIPKNSKAAKEAKQNLDASVDNRPKMTRTIKGAKEVVIPIAALKGHGYPQPVAMVLPPMTASKAKKSGKK